MSTKEIQQELVSTMKRWQKVENEAIASTGEVIKQTDNPIIRLVMEIIQRDSQMHYWVQGWIADTLEFKTVSLSPDELEKVWAMVEKHIEIEKKTIELAEKSLSSIKGRKMVVQEYLLKYLLEDEQKHSNLLSQLEGIKLGQHPY